MIEKTRQKDTVIRICDICGDRREVKLATVEKNRKYRKREQDLCISCGNKKHYQQNPLPVGEDNPRWKGGLNNGYQFVYWRDPVSGRSCKKREHRIVVESHLGRELSSAEKVHHVDMVKTNNDLQNLYLCATEKDHQSVHASMEECGFQLLTRKIWFDPDARLYGLQKCPPYRCPLRKVELDQNVNIRTYGKLRYEFSRCRITKTERPRHVLILEKVLGRRLFRNEVVHHIDGNTLNNHVDNLFVMTVSLHLTAHKSLQQCVADLFLCGEVIFDRGKYEHRVC